MVRALVSFNDGFCPQLFLTVCFNQYINRGIVERSSWDGGEYGFEANSEAEEEARRERTAELYKDRVPRGGRGRGRGDGRDGRGGRGGRGDFSFDQRRNDFGDRSRERGDGVRERRPVREVRDRRDGSRNDRFDRPSRGGRDEQQDWASASKAVKDESDDFFSSLMKELYDEEDSSSIAPRGTRRHDNAGPNANKSETNRDEDSFFENLMSELGGALGKPEPSSSGNDSGDDDAFFANLESELSSSLGSGDAGSSDDDFFVSLQDEMNESFNKSPAKENSELQDDFFSSLMDDVADEVESTPRVEKQSSKPKAAAASSGDFDSMSVPELKDLLRSKGMKVGGRKSELIDRLQGN